VKLIVGLGNPGSKYSGTRHNVGFDVVDELARRLCLEFESAPTNALMARQRGAGMQIMLAKPLTFMNRSGEAVDRIRLFYRIELSEMLIVTDDANLPLGRLRARPSGSDGGHNGLASVINSLGTDVFSRLRIGIGRGGDGRKLTGHVLSRFDDLESREMKDVIDRAVDAVQSFVIDGIDVMMNRFNRVDQVAD